VVVALPASGPTAAPAPGGSAEDGPFPVRGSDLTFRLDWTTTEHSGVDVPVTAVGPSAARFTGRHPNTHVHQVLSPILTC